MPQDETESRTHRYLHIDVSLDTHATARAPSLQPSERPAMASPFRRRRTGATEMSGGLALPDTDLVSLREFLRLWCHVRCSKLFFPDTIEVSQRSQIDTPSQYHRRGKHAGRQFVGNDYARCASGRHDITLTFAVEQCPMRVRSARYNPYLCGRTNKHSFPQASARNRRGP